MRAKSETESVRLNISLSKECIERIDQLMESSRCYNSRADFVSASLRHMVWKYWEVADAVLTAAEKKHGRPVAGRSEYMNRMRAIGQGLEGRFGEQFGRNLNVQISVRLVPAFFDQLSHMDDISPCGIQTLARMAIVDYCDEVSRNVAAFRRTREIRESLMGESACPVGNAMSVRDGTVRAFTRNPPLHGRNVKRPEFPV